MLSSRTVGFPAPGVQPGNLSKRTKGARPAAAIVEMAVVAPLFFLLILGSIEFGRAMMAANVITSAAREGARAGVLPLGTNAEVTAAVQKELTAAGISAAHSTISIYVNDAKTDTSGAVSGDVVKVTVEVPFSAVSWLPTPLFLTNGTQLRGQAVMRRE